MTRLLSFGLDKEDEVTESVNEVREGLEDRWLALRGMLCEGIVISDLPVAHRQPSVEYLSLQEIHSFSQG